MAITEDKEAFYNDKGQHKNLIMFNIYASKTEHLSM